MLFRFLWADRFHPGISHFSSNFKFVLIGVYETSQKINTLLLPACLSSLVKLYLTFPLLCRACVLERLWTGLHHWPGPAQGELQAREYAQAQVLKPRTAQVGKSLDQSIYRQMLAKSVGLVVYWFLSVHRSIVDSNPHWFLFGWIDIRIQVDKMTKKQIKK